MSGKWSRRTVLKSLSAVPIAAAVGWGLRCAQAETSQLLRPPGAASDEDFLAACIRCDQCIQVCPQECLQPATFAKGWSGVGAPYISARDNPCDLCAGRDQLECIAACPTPALLPVESRAAVRMGVAVIDADLCLPFLGVSCKACWHACPFPQEALIFNELGRPQVIAEGCVGCGLCDYACLAEKTAIQVTPWGHETTNP